MTDNKLMIVLVDEIELVKDYCEVVEVVVY